VKKTDPTTDFERALQESNVEEAPPESVGLPAIFPGSREKIIVQNTGVLISLIPMTLPN